MFTDLVVCVWNRVMCACTTSSLDGLCTGAMFLGILSGKVYSCMSCQSLNRSFVTSSNMVTK